MTELRRVRATNKQRKATRKAKPSDYQAMATLAGSVVVQSRGMQFRTGNPEYVLFEFPFWVVFGKGFPKGHIVSKTRATNTFKINAVKLLDWLYENKHSPYNATMLLRQTREFEEINNRLDRMFRLEE